MNSLKTLKILSLALSTVGMITATALPGTAVDLAGLNATGLDCTSSLVTAGGSNFSVCQGAFAGNDNQLLAALNNGLFSDYVNGGTWSLWGKSDEGQLIADEGETSGIWSLFEGDSLDGPFVISLKTSTSFSAFLFTEVSDIVAGTFTADGVSTNDKDTAQELSHASIFVHETTGEEVVELDEPSLSFGGIFMLLAGAPLAFAMTKTKQA